MTEVFDEDLIKELGLEPEDVMGPKGDQPEKPAAHPAPASGPSAQARATMGQPTRPPIKPQLGVKAPIVHPQKPGVPVATRPAPQTTHEPFEAEALKVSEDIPVQIAAVLAKRTLVLKDVLDLKAGEVLEFKKTPQEPLDLVANGRLIGRGELVLVDGKLGVRIVKLVNAS